MGKRRGKRDGTKRAYLKRFSANVIHISPGPTKGWANEYYIRARSEGQDHPPIVEWKNDRRQGVTRYNYILMPNGLKMYFNGTKFFFIEEFSTHVRRSIFYSSSIRAKDAYTREEIVWKFTGPSVNSMLSDLPS